jgi:SEC-C motif-containing protein
MRSRYTAHVLGVTEYLISTWSEHTRPASIELEDVHWLGLKIKRTEKGGEGDREGVVEFVARYKVGGRGYRLHEISRFSKQAGAWYYLDGEHVA